MRCTLIGPVSPPNSGPGIKNQILIDELLAKGLKVNVINTLNYKKNVIKTFLKLIFDKNKQTILATSKNGRNLLVPFLFLKKLIFRNFKYIVIPMGGNLPQELIIKNNISKYLFLNGMKKSDLVLVESTKLKNILSVNCELDNVEYFPNFKKRVDFKFLKENKISQGKIFKCIFLSSVKKSKGVELPLKPMAKIMKELGVNIIYDIYGPYREGYEKELEEILKDYPFASYKGVVASEEVSEVISSYDLFIFPTYYEGEGFPAVFIDAFIAETPVLCSDNNYNKEIVKEGFNGSVFKSKDTLDLEKKLKILVTNPNEIKKMKTNNKSEKEKYYSDILVGELLELLTKKLGWK